MKTKTKQIAFRVDQELYAKLSAEAEKRGICISKLIRHVLRNWRVK